MNKCQVEITEKERAFIGAYVDAIYFTETGDIDQPDSGDDLCEVFMRESIIDCLAFYSRVCCYVGDDKIEQAGHDFWLTRNGHGAGFWDGDWSEGDNTFIADLLTKVAESFGEAYAVHRGRIG